MIGNRKKIIYSTIYFGSIAALLFFFFLEDFPNKVATEVVTEKKEVLVQKEAKERELTSKDVADSILFSIKKKYYKSDGMVESEKQRTTSESQSYGMLIAVFSDDREVFNKTWSWTKDNLQSQLDGKLFSWLWQNGKISDSNPATDADQDIAYALYLAYEQWRDPAYLEAAKDIVRDIWNIETKEVNGIRYVGAGNWAVKEANGIIINPSYLAPYQYRVFGTFDTEHDWLSLVDSSYRALELCSGDLGLAMDWCKLDQHGNIVSGYVFGTKDGSIHSYDALRVPYRVAMDYKLNAEPRALEFLKKDSVSRGDWKKYGKVFAVYDQYGNHRGNDESLANYGALLVSMDILDKEIADEIFEKKIADITSLEKNSFYDLSWLWFGLYSYSK